MKNIDFQMIFMGAFFSFDNIYQKKFMKRVQNRSFKEDISDDFSIQKKGKPSMEEFNEKSTILSHSDAKK